MSDCFFRLALFGSRALYASAIALSVFFALGVGLHIEGLFSGGVMQHPSVQEMLLSSLHGILKLWASTAVPVAALAWLLTWRPRVIGKGD